MANMRAKVVFDRAFVQFHKNDYQSAVELFKEAIMEDPHYPEALYNLSCCYAILGQNEDALVYLDRAIKLDVSCLDWAKEDVELDSIRSTQEFQKVLARNDPVKKRHMGEDAKLDEDDVDLDDGGFIHGEGAFGGTIPGAKGPQCAQCGALVVEEYLPYVNKYIALTLALSGIVTLFYFFSSPLGVGLGLPTIGIGLFSYKKKRFVSVCSNCGASGKAVIPDVESEESFEVEGVEPGSALKGDVTGEPAALIEDEPAEPMEDALEEAIEEMEEPLEAEEVASQD